MVLTYGEPKKGYLNFTLGNLWATQKNFILAEFLIYEILEQNVL